MLNVKDPKPSECLPPYRYVKNNWEKKLETWQTAYAANAKANPEEVIDISSKYILKDNDPNYDTLKKRDSLRVVHGFDENLYLFDAMKNCKNLLNVEFEAPHNNMMANYGEIAKVFDQETKKSNGGKRIPDGNMDAQNKPTYYGFYGPDYKYSNILALGRICEYEAEMKEKKDRKCSEKLLKFSKILHKYEAYGVTTTGTDRLTLNAFFYTLYESLLSAKSEYAKKYSANKSNPLLEKARVYVSKD